MTDSDSSQTVDITFNHLFPWLLIFFCAAMVVIGFLFLMPFMPRQNILLGVGIISASAIGIFAGRIWLRNLPVMMRLKPEGLEVVRKKMVYRWEDIDHVAVKSVYVNGQVSYLCIRLRLESRAQYDIEPSGMISSAIRAIGGDYDLVFNDQEFSHTAEELKREIDARIIAVS